MANLFLFGFFAFCFFFSIKTLLQLGVSSTIILDFQFEINFERREETKFLKNVFCFFIYLFIYLFFGFTGGRVICSTDCLNNSFL